MIRFLTAGVEKLKSVMNAIIGLLAIGFLHKSINELMCAGIYEDDDDKPDLFR